MDLAAAQALIRFGLGRRGTEAPPADPRAWLLGQLRAPDPWHFPAAPTTADGLRAVRTDRRARRGPIAQRAAYRADAGAELANWLGAAAPFRERLVLLWANHFTVSFRHGGVAALAGAFAREAIRPHVTGRFADMLLAVMRHPAMLIYLDNATSIGPDSGAGRRLHRGLNENLARECLELHTIGRDGGYTQADVTSFARILTGWSIDRKADPPGFRFRPFAHEPGPDTMMGRRFPPGEEGGIAALRFLADHPATRRRLAERLVRHFVSDAPPPAAVAQVQAALDATGGDLGAAAAAVVALPQAWAPLAKLRAPDEYAVAVLRALDPPAPLGPRAFQAFAALGQPLWGAPLPNGWPDIAAEWSAPAAMLRRVDWAHAVAGHASEADPVAMAEASLGPLLRPATRDALHHAASRREALALLFSSPEFQRR